MTMPPRASARSRYAAIALTGLLGTLLTIGAFFLVCSWEYRVAEIDFQSKAESYLNVINADLGDARTLLYTIAAFIGSTEHPVTATEFAHFSAALHRRVPGLRDTAWAALSRTHRSGHRAQLSRFSVCPAVLGPRPVQSRDCTEAQGFLFSPARPNAEVPALLRSIDARATSAFDPRITVVR